jgi:subtilase family serine protease
VAQVESAFHSEIHHYNVNGEKHFANADELSVPTALAGAVQGFRGLDDFRPRPHLRMPASSKYTSSVSGNHFLAPEDFATIYDLTALYTLDIDGTGQTIAVVGDSDVTLSNIGTFRTLSGLSATNLPVKLLVPSSGTAIVPSAGEQIEAYLDLEWSGAIAKNANIVYVYVGNGNLTVWDALEYAIDNTNHDVNAQVVSTSFGFCEPGLGATFAGQLQTLVQFGNSLGETVVAAAGDSGAADCDNDSAATLGLAVDLPAGVPEVTGVGGGEFTGDSTTGANTYWNGSNDADNGSAIMYIPEEVWNDTVEQGALDAGGGGVSTFFGKPSWQSGANFLSSGRNVPDVTLSASNNHDPYLLCTGTNSVTGDGLQTCATGDGFRDSSGNLDPVGGTSAGAPTFAGIVALLDQAVNPAGLGNINLQLYPLATNTPSAFHDITSGNNIVPCVAGTPSSDPVALRCPTTGTPQIGYSAAVGYDQASGLGSVEAFNLVTNWPGFSNTPTYAVGGTAVIVSSPGSPGTSTITVDALNGFNGTVNLTCTPPSSATALITCSIPASVTVNGTNTTTTLTVNTTAAHFVPGTFSAANRGMGWFAASGGGLFAGVLVMGVPSRRRKYTAMFGMVLLAFAVTGVACGGGSSSTGPTNPGTPAGNYTVVVSAVSGSISRTLNVSVTVK